MNTRTLLPLAALVVLTTACAESGGSSSAALDTEAQQASYGIGLNMGQNLQPAEGRLDMSAFLRGVEDAMAGNEPALEQEVIQTALNAFSQAINEEMAAEQEAAAAENLAAGAAFLAENQAREGVTVTESGLQYEVLEEGSGARPGPTDMARLHYRGTLIDGTEFDSSIGGAPAEFGVGGVIPGFSEALQLMPVGSKYRVVIPSDIAYGPQGSQSIGPNSVLIFEIELIEIL
jgi:FKBP-type peptidyl-prolyl cis-trans isomerase